MNLADNLVSAAERFGERTALRLDDDTITYAEFLEQALAAAGLVRSLGVEPGDRIALVSPNVPAYPIVFYGALLAGCAVVPMNPLLSVREMGYYFTDSGAKAVFAVDAVAEAVTKAAAETGVPVVVVRPGGPSAEQLDGTVPLTAPVPRIGSDIATILYTSGTTGQPKGALLTHDNLASNAKTSATALIEATPDDVVMGCLPLFHVFGLTCGLNAAVASGMSLALLPRFDPVKALALIAKHHVTIFEGVPTMYAAMLGTSGDDDTSSLRTCLSGGSAMPVPVLRAFEERFGCQILEGYGLSETSPVASFNQPGQERKPGTIGTAVPGMAMMLIDDDGNPSEPGAIGEIAIKGDGVMAGYHGKPEATAEAIVDGWFRSGDLAVVDDEGFFTIVDRKKQLIIRGGYNVYPREVEEALYEHPSVAEAAVVGIPHPTLGEEIGAAVAVKAGASFDPDALKAFVKERVAAYKYPRHIWQVEALPKGPTGKILHREISAPDAAKDTAAKDTAGNDTAAKDTPAAAPVEA
jgi:long-chain acyl-CoA synthetase